MARRRQRDAFARFDCLERMTFYALRAIERHSAADCRLHISLVARDATGRGRLLVHRLPVLKVEVRAGVRGLAGLVADQTALRALAERLFYRSERFSLKCVVADAHVRLVVERRGKPGLLTGFLRKPGQIEFGVDNLTVEPKHGQFRTRPLLFFIQAVAADAVGRKGRGLLVHLLFVEVTDEAFLVTWRALLDALGELHAADWRRLLILIMAGGALEVVLLFEFALVFEQFFEGL